MLVKIFLLAIMLIFSFVASLDVKVEGNKKIVMLNYYKMLFIFLISTSLQAFLW